MDSFITPTLITGAFLAPASWHITGVSTTNYESVPCFKSWPRQLVHCLDSYSSFLIGILTSVRPEETWRSKRCPRVTGLCLLQARVNETKMSTIILPPSPHPPVDLQMLLAKLPLITHLTCYNNRK